MSAARRSPGAAAGAVDAAHPAVEDLPVEIRRSARRRRTISAQVRDGVLVVMVPAGLSAREEQQWVRRMQQRLARRAHRRPTGDDDLEARAQQLSRTYFDGAARPRSVRWSTRQRTRWGSCTPSTGDIRLSTQLQGMPTWVIDSVLIHELAHLLEANHGPAFHRLVERYPRTVRAEAFLHGVAWAQGRLSEADDPDEDPPLDGPEGDEQEITAPEDAAPDVD
ncbi:M48 family metallopeptidase [Brachybacterium sp. EF45031]|uniref:M48 metallopeptidase family protein n=1 Tax=Brachybacterium sillae TaxID=2810536 RepID=UPI00217E2F01|nr:M48 family metallopeptidase [Brachybacterium sillae]MCS6712458.1 M48 family metallopeptidase [Brachybacterium sillae]